VSSIEQLCLTTDVSAFARAATVAEVPASIAAHCTSTCMMAASARMPHMSRLATAVVWFVVGGMAENPMRNARVGPGSFDVGE
jgi:hypothetical protein